jgi:predicted outer membrane repeat protein
MIMKTSAPTLNACLSRFTPPQYFSLKILFLAIFIALFGSNAHAQTWQTVVNINRTTFSQSPANTVYTVPAGGPYRYRITVKGGNGGTSLVTGSSGNPTYGGRGGVFTSEYNMTSGWTLDCVAGSNGLTSSRNDQFGSGGGGSSGVYLYAPEGNGPLIVAGGGGGAGGGYVIRDQPGGDAVGYSSAGSGSGGGAGGTVFYPAPNDWAGGGGGGLGGNGGDNNLGKGGKLHTAGGGMGGNSNVHPSFTSLTVPGGGGFTGGGGGSALKHSAGGGGGGYSGGGGGGNGFNLSTPDGYGGGGGTSFNSTLGFNTTAFSWADYTSTGGSVKVEILVRLSDFGTVIPTALPDDLVFEFNQLEALYRATNGANWANKTNWLTSGDMSAWHGVTLTADGKSVLKIELPSNNLTGGNIPDLNLNQLTTLNLRGNTITGAIPNFNYLPVLTDLNLAINQFSGSVPLFNNCTALQNLNLAINQLTGSVPNFLDHNWLSIDLGLNQLSGNLPALTLGSLQFFSVYGNNLSGQIPNLTIPNLTGLNIAFNNFSGTLPPVLNGSGIGFAVASTWVNDNNYNFGSLLNSPLLNGAIVYAPQKKIGISYTNGALEVNTGVPSGSTTQTFYWYKDNAVVAVNNNNWYRPTATGTYRVEVAHSTLTIGTGDKNLILVSNNFTVSTIPKSNAGRNFPADLPACLTDDFNELEKIYDATGGANWTNKTNWLTSGNIASWHGVWGMSANGCDVADLVLNSNNLNGILPNLSFPSATRLSFADNLLREGIPTITAPNLKILGFSSNQLSGNIPNFGFTLDEFYISNNRFIYGDMEGKNWLNTPVLHYKDQAIISTIVSNCVLSVNTGSTATDQTFIWFRRNANNSLTEVARNNTPQYTPSVSGTYLCYAYHFVLSRADIPARNLVLVSNDIALTVPPASSISIVVSPSTTANFNQLVTFTATPVNALPEHSYQWQVNGTNVGTNSLTFSTLTLRTGDVVTCRMNLPANICSPTPSVLSNSLTMNIICPSILYVKPVASGTGDGTSWANAMSDLDAAIFNTCGTTQIWVAKGTYYPSRNNPGAFVNFNGYFDNKLRSFVIPSGIQLYGGFEGTETATNQRTPANMANGTVLSGGENSHHVVFILNPTQDIRLDGFVIRDGRTFQNERSLAPYLTIYGAGILIQDAGNRVTLANCTLRNNVGYTGGALFCLGSSPTVTNCFFVTNSATLHGAAVYNDNSAPTFTNCVFWDNRASNGLGGGVGGVMYNINGSAPTLNHATITNNSSIIAAIYNTNSTSTVSNSIIWGNLNGSFSNFGTGSAVVSNSIVEGGIAGVNIKTTNPNFVNAASAAGADGLLMTADDGLRIGCNSPAFNAATSGALSFDMLYNNRSQLNQPDMGAYESTTEVTPITASLSMPVVNCGSRVVTASGNPSNGGSTFAWSGGSTPSVATNTFTTSGTFTVTVTNSVGCTATQSVTFNNVETPARLYVNAANTNTTKDGLSWATAFDNLQSALSACKTSGAEIWVARGTYKPSVDRWGSSALADNRTKTFLLTENIQVYGGFAGTETNLSQRTPSVIGANPTILSGDFSGNDAVSGNGSSLSISGFEENAYNVVVVTSSGTTRLDGFTILGGCANLASNYADYGGGVLCLNGGSFTLSNCILTKNAANYGGGLSNVGSTTSTQILNSVFERNLAFLHGASVSNNLNSSSTFNNCVFSGGYALQVGGVIYNNNSINVLNNCTLVGNASALSYGASLYNDVSRPILTNCILWANQPAVPFVSYLAADPDVNYSIIQGGFAGTNNTSTDPLFNNIADPDGADNQWFTSDDGVRLGCGSPAFNSGNNATATTTDIRGTSRPQLTTADRGAYENTTDLTIPNIIISGTTTGCGTVNLTASGGGTYAWSGGSTPSVASNVFTNSGTYTVTVTSTGGCLNTASQAITINSSPTVSFTDQVITCAGATVTANGGDTYAWSGGITPSAARNSFPVSGTYTVTVTNSTTNCSTSQSITLNLPTAAARLYVNAANTNPVKDGLTWATAFTDLQTALETCTSVEREIWIAKGTYKPSRGMSAFTSEPRRRAFVLASGIKIYGGFAGTEAYLSERTLSVIGANPTILSGDFNGDDVVSGAGTTLSIANNSENAYTVVVAVGAAASTVVDGLIISGGNANDDIRTTNVQGSLVLHNNGGGMYQIQSAVTLNRVIFRYNSANYGGGLYNSTASPTLTNCVFDRNATSLHGAAMVNYLSAAPQLYNCIFVGGRAYGVGGAIYNLDRGNVSITNSTFFNNTAEPNGAVIYCDFSDITVTNCLAWGNPNTRNFGAFSTSFFQVRYSTMEGFNEGDYGSNTNNGNAHNFRNSNDPDGADNQWFTADDGLQLGCVSSAFNTGNNASTPATDILGIARPQFSTTDRGAYESTIDLANSIQSVQISGATTACSQVSLTASVMPSATYSYAWSGGNTPSVASNTFTASGTYTVTVTAGNGCTATANETVSISQPVTPTVSIVVSPSNTIAYGTNVTFTATPTNGGTTPQYQWYMDNIPVGTNSATYSTTLLGHGRTVRCVLTSNFSCLTTTTASSNTITMNVLDCASVNRLYVKPTASGIGDGSSWANATNDLQGAINNVCGVIEVWVANGTYKPTRDLLGNLNPTDPRDKAFLLKNEFRVYGGFVGTEGSLSERPTALGSSILSGDVNGDDNGFGNNGENVYHVVASVSDDNTTVLDGFTIKSGNANGTGTVTVEGKEIGRGSAGGLYLSASSPSVTNCIVTSNCGGFSGAMIHEGASAPQFSRSVFHTNRGAYGGVSFNATGSTPKFTNVVFHQNTATVLGGAFYHQLAAPTFINCTFNGSSSHNEQSTLTATNCIFNNSAVVNPNGFLAIAFSAVAGISGTGNTTANPQLVDAADPDGADNQWFTADDGLRLACNSPARDAGSNAGVPLNDVSENGIFNGVKDIGAYEKQDNDGCPIFTTTTACQSTSIAGVSGNRLYNFFINNQLVAVLNPNGQNLGTVTVEIASPSGENMFNGVKHLGRNINVTSTIAPTTHYTLCLFYKNTELNAFSTTMGRTIARNSLNMAWRSGGSSGCDLGMYAGTSTGLVSSANITNVDYGTGNDGFYLQFNLNHFTIFAPVAPSSVLPVELLAFEGQNREGGNLLIWKTAEEKNVRNFDLERSIDGQNFIKIGTVKSRGSNSAYSYFDNQPIFGLNYYRLKINDLDGKTSFSKIISLENKSTKKGIKVYPNPVDYDLTVEMGQITEGGILIVNSIGQVVFQQKSSLNSILKIDVSRWVSGVYFIKSGEEVVKFVKN